MHIERLAPALLIVTAVAAFGDEPVRYEITQPERPRHDKVRVEAEDEKVQVVVDHVFGIDSASIRADGTWAEKVSVRFVGFKALEGFFAANAEYRCEGRLGFDEKKSQTTAPLQRVKRSEPVDQEEPNVDSDEAESVTVRITRTKDGIVVRIPKALLPGPKGTLELRWVDAYRG